MPCLSQLQLWFWSYGLIRLLGPSGPDVVSGSQTPRSKWWLVCEVGATVMDVWLTTSSGPKWPKCSFQVPDTNVKKYFDISWFYWIHLMILEKMMSCLWKLHVWFWTYGLIGLLGTNGPYVVSGSQTPRSINFLRFHDLIGFISWFLRKCWSVSENCSYGSGHMVWYVFWAQVVQM